MAQCDIEGHRPCTFRICGCCWDCCSACQNDCPEPLEAPMIIFSDVPDDHVHYSCGCVWSPSLGWQRTAGCGLHGSV